MDGFAVPNASSNTAAILASGSASERQKVHDAVRAWLTRVGLIVPQYADPAYINRIIGDLVNVLTGADGQDQCAHRLPSSWGAHCRPTASPSTARRTVSGDALQDIWADYGPEFTAGFDSDCGGCGARILEGDTIRMKDGGAECPDCLQDHEADNR